MNVFRQPTTKSLSFFLAMLLCTTAAVFSEQPTELRDASIEKGFEPVLMQLPIIVREGGAAVVDTAAGRYFVAVGVTDVRGESSEDTLRHLRVGQIQAQKVTVSYIEGTKIVSEEKLVEKTTILNKDGKKSVEVLKTLDQTTATAVKGTLKSLPGIGTWKSTDGKLFFYAIGKKLD
jgi:hypothetical protein